MEHGWTFHLRIWTQGCWEETPPTPLQLKSRIPPLRVPSLGQSKRIEEAHGRLTLRRECSGTSCDRLAYEMLPRREMPIQASKWNQEIKNDEMSKFRTEWKQQRNRKFLVNALACKNQEYLLGCHPDQEDELSILSRDAWPCVYALDQILGATFRHVLLIIAQWHCVS